MNLKNDMASDIFIKILEDRIYNFTKSFVESSESIFKENNQLIHPGEFGVYRERAAKQLISSVIPSDLNISDGFIITSTNKNSTQCDLIIHSNKFSPILKDDLAQFLFVESVFAIGEVKSTLSKEQLKKALIKLSKIKKLGEETEAVNSLNGKHLDFRNSETDQIVSFLICKKLNFDIKKLDFDQIYSGIEYRNRHNFILSIEDGLFYYDLNLNNLHPNLKDLMSSDGFDITQTRACEYPVFKGHPLKNKFYKINAKHITKHIKVFLNSVSVTVTHKTHVSADLVGYYDNPISMRNKNV